MPNDDKFVFRKIIIDVFCFGIVAVANKLIREYAVTFKRGFFCNDESLSYPYKDSTVTTPVMYSITTVVPVFIILITEYFSPANKKSDSSKVLAGFNIPSYIWECYKVIGVFLFGAACSHITTDFTKHVVGRLRPHFMDVCRPNINCSLPENQHRYIEQFECLGTDDSHKLREMRLSFMSGHSSFPAYCMIFLGLYVYARWTWRGSKLLRHMVQLVAFLFAWFTALSRLSDYKHHWSDVAVGLIQGALVAVLTVVYVSELLPSRPQHSKDSTNAALPMVQKETSGFDSSDN